MSSTNLFYVNPLGGTTDISYNNVGSYIKNKSTIDARLEDSIKKSESNNLQLYIWSFSAGISILILLIILRNLNK
tara:strand:+ start:1106 stop:1330 length:225 start_codon:yes stop_codon:yes gene_type:complete